MHVNRYKDQNANHFLYNWTHFDKRNRLTHNMCMEHFEVHKEKLEDLIVDLNLNGPGVFEDLKYHEKKDILTLDDFALIDEMSGLTDFIDDFVRSHQVPEIVKKRIESHMIRYSGEKTKDIARNDLRMKMFGASH